MIKDFKSAIMLIRNSSELTPIEQNVCLLVLNKPLRKYDKPSDIFLLNYLCSLKILRQSGNLSYEFNWSLVKVKEGEMEDPILA
jgi:hypothetical protein